MNFFIYLILISVIMFSLLSIYFLYKKMAINLFYNLAIKGFLKKQYKTSSDRYFSSYAIRQTIKILMQKRQKNILLNLIFARTDGAINFLKNIKKYDLAISLQAHFDYEKSLREFEILIKNDPKNYFILGEMAELYYLTNNYNKLSLVIDKIDEKKANSYTLAKKLYFQSLVYIKEGDMFPVSKDGNKIVKLFNKNKAYIEEARTYIMLGLMYKGCAIFDTAQFIFQTALDIYSELNDKIGMIETYGNLGMLMSAQERYDETEDYLNKALELSSNSKLESHILNQKGLANLLKQDMSTALESLEKAMDINTLYNNVSGLAFGNEIISYVKYEQKLFDESIKHAKIAEELYEAVANYSALLESKYSQALAYFELKDWDNSEKISREIIDISKKETTNFHIANTYNLLGLIFINKGDFDRAEALFKESLRLEQKNDRFDGVATDYFNISIVELEKGEQEQALKSLDSALEYALMYGETNLSTIIRNRIKSLSLTLLDVLCSHLC